MEFQRLVSSPSDQTNNFELFYIYKKIQRRFIIVICKTNIRNSEIHRIKICCIALMQYFLILFRILLIFYKVLGSYFT